MFLRTRETAAGSDAVVRGFEQPRMARTKFAYPLPKPAVSRPIFGLSPFQKAMKRTLIVSGIALLLLSVFFGWRALHPPLTDREQIAANLDAITKAAGARDAQSIANFMAPTFGFNGNKGTTRKEFQRQLYAGMMNYRVVDLQINGVQVNVNGDTANSDGRYLLNVKSEFDSPSDPTSGAFKLKWQKLDGEWKITEVEGAPTSG